LKAGASVAQKKRDIDHPLFCVDVKLRKRWEVESWFNVLRTYAFRENKIPILTLRKPSTTPPESQIQKGLVKAGSEVDQL